MVKRTYSSSMGNLKTPKELMLIATKNRLTLIIMLDYLLRNIPKIFKAYEIQLDLVLKFNWTWVPFKSYDGEGPAKSSPKG